ncbi:MAG: isocitrate/isopropylmalate dehydrogenase family protein, partial [Desulfurococcales archaeon]|nr:isocitrate/isopropylmalate dehydrogenase family protein [Desulfurococcales archaeon]
MGYRVGVIRGDGVGPEVIPQALKALQAAYPDLEFVDIKAGYAYFKSTGRPIEEGGLDLIKSLDATIKGPLQTPPGPNTMRSINVFLRKELGLHTNVRPFTSYRGVSLHQGFEFVIFRENLEGLYSGIEGRIHNTAVSLKVVTAEETRKVVREALRYAEMKGLRRVTAIHKANILKESDGLFREVFWEEVRGKRFEADELFVDAAAYWMVKDPVRFQALVTPNLYGDILSDLAAGITGSLGLCGSAQIGDDVAVFEPVHGTAPDIAGKGIANPISAVRAAALLLEY